MAPDSEALTDVRTSTPRTFEHEVAWLINVLTEHKAIVIGGAGDGGVDIKVYDDDRLVGIAQCKQYDPRHALAPGHVRELYAAKAQFGVIKAYLVTTTRFTPDTINEAERLNIDLIDGEKLERMRTKARQIVRSRDERLSMNDT